METIKKEEMLRNILGRVQIQTNLFHHANALINRNKRQTPELSKLLSELYPECLTQDEADAEVYLGIVREEMKLGLDTELKHFIAKASKPALDAIAKKIKTDPYLEIAYSNAKHVLAENNPGIQEVSRKAVIDIMLEDILARGDKSLRARLLRICDLIK